MEDKNTNRLKAHQYDDHGNLIAIAFTWNLEDVYAVAEEKSVELSNIEASQVLGIMYKYHDCNHGMAWDSVESAIDDIVEKRTTMSYCVKCEKLGYITDMELVEECDNMQFYQCYKCSKSD